jgi:hypothetical protein
MAVAAERTSDTPLLDRRESLPPAIRATLLPVIVICSLAVLVVVVSLLQGPSSDAQAASETTASQSGADALWLMIFTPIAVIAGVVIHEAGHLLAGLAVGLRFEAVQIGRLHLTRSGVQRLQKSFGGPAGFVVMWPTTERGLTWRWIVLAAAGPAANALSAAIVLAWPGKEAGLRPIIGFIWLLAARGESTVSHATTAGDKRL